jgi:hypothetical protein
MQTSPSRETDSGLAHSATRRYNLRARLYELLDQTGFQALQIYHLRRRRNDEAHAFGNFAAFDHARGDFDSSKRPFAHEPI